MSPPSDSKIVCECLQVTEAQLVKAIKTRDLRDLNGVAAHTLAGDGCTSCHPLLGAYLRKLRGEAATCRLPRPAAAQRDSSQALPL